jgi:hypothetical protein
MAESAHHTWLTKSSLLRGMRLALAKETFSETMCDRSSFAHGVCPIVVCESRGLEKQTFLLNRRYSWKITNVL